MFNNYTNFGNDILIDDVVQVYDYNNDGKIDGINLIVKNQGNKFSANIAVIVDGSALYSWHLASDKGTVIENQAKASLFIYANTTSDQLDIGDYIVGIGESVEKMSYADAHIGGDLNIADPVTVTVSGLGGPVPGVGLSFLRVDGLPSGVSGITTNQDGVATVHVLPNYYKIRTSDNIVSKIFHSAENNSVNFISSTGSVSIKVIDGSNTPVSGITVYITDGNRLELGSSGVTNSSGLKTFTLGTGTYYFRVNYLGTDYYSSQISIPLPLGSSSLRTIKIGNSNLGGIGLFATTPIGNGKLIRLYTENNVSMGRYAYSNSTSEFQFSGIPSGFYRLRLDYMGSRFWSTVVSTSDPYVEVNFGGGALTIKVTAGGSPLPNGVLTRLYYSNNRSTYSYDYLNASSFAEYGGRPPGEYRLRIDWLGKYTYTTAFNHTTPSVKNLDIPGGKLNIQVLAGGDPLPNGVLVRLYNANNRSTYRYDYLNSSGYAEFGSILSGDYRLRVDWLGKYTYTTSFSHVNNSAKVVSIPGGPLNVHVFVGTANLANGVLLRLYNANNRSTYRYDYANATGWGEFGVILGGDYRLRVDWLGQYIYTTAFTHTGNTGINVTINGGALTIKVTAGGYSLPNGVLTRLYNSNGRSTYRYDYLNSTGYAEYGAIPSGNYKLRVDWLGKYTYSSVFSHLNSTAKTVDYAGGYYNISITIGGKAIHNGVLARLYNSNGGNTYRYAYTSGGNMILGAILAGDYKIRLDYMSMYTYSSVFTFNGTHDTVNYAGFGSLSIKVTDNVGSNYATNTLVRLYTSSGSNTGRYAYTNSSSYVTYTDVLNSSFRLGIGSQRSDPFQSATGLTIQVPGTGLLQDNKGASGGTIIWRKR